MVERIVVGAHYGLRDWLVQRVTAVVLALYAVFMIAFIVTHLPLEFQVWKALFAHQTIRLFTLFFLLSLLLHSWIGVRNILMDYVHPMGLRLALEVLTVLALVAYALWSASILWST
jgi:succinate dehydrogenase / fumarate reductase, membrane anchor subunit